MPIWKKSTPNSTCKIGVLLFDRFSNLCLANAVEPLRAANTLARSPLYSFQFLTVDGRDATSSSGLQVKPDERLGKEGSGTYLFLMPSYDYLQHVTADTIRGLRSAAKRYDTIAGFDTGSWLMAEAGLLDGRFATIHWEELDSFQEKFANTSVLKERYVVDTNRITCTGASAAFDLVVQLIADHHGESLALELTTLFMQTGVPETDFPAHRRYSPILSRALSAMRNTLEEPLSIRSLSREIGVSQRKLETMFRQELYTNPQSVYKKMRLDLALKLVRETDLSIAEIAVRSGYVSASSMTRAFRVEFGKSPTQWRKPSNAR